MSVPTRSGRVSDPGLRLAERRSERSENGALPEGFDWEEPTCARGRPSLLAQIAPCLPALRAHPGRWARVKTYRSASSATSGATLLRRRHADALRGFEFVGGRAGPGGAVWARYLPSDPAR